VEKDTAEGSIPSEDTVLHHRIEAIRELVPESFREGVLDFAALRSALGNNADGPPEKYTLTWAGKLDAIRSLQVVPWATLIPAKDESLQFDSTENVFIEGENLEVLKLLYKSYFGRVKMVYLDPPYNTGGDFLYPDNFTDASASYLRLTGQIDAEGNLLTSNPEAGGRYHSAWLSMMYPRLFVARQLLRDDGLIFISIDDHEVHNLLLLMNELFGEENRIETFIWKKSYGGGAKEKYAVTQHEYVLLYAKNKQAVDDLWLPPDEEAEARYYRYKDEKLDTRGPYRLKPLEATRSMDARKNLVFPITAPWGDEIWPKRQWWWKRERVLQALANNELEFTRNGEATSVSYKQYLRDEAGVKRRAKPFSIIDGIYTQQGTADLARAFPDDVVMQFPKPVALLKMFIAMATDTNTSDLILDLFAGSGTMGEAVVELNTEDGGNRRYLLVQLPEPITPPKRLADGTELHSIADVGLERVRRVLTRKTADEPTKLIGFDGKLDFGIRAFRMAPSNFRAWHGPGAQVSGDEYVEQLRVFIEPLVDGWKTEDVFFELMLQQGFPVTSHVEALPSVSEHAVRITDDEHEQSFYVDLSSSVDLQTIRTLALTADDVFICRGIALDDSTAANLALQSQLKTI
jgi:adenine-specific DNA-methyltransferase